jgi:signal peptidase
MGAVPIRPRKRLTRRQRFTNTLFVLGLLMAATVWLFTFRPQRLGGPVAYVMIEGTSMIPTYHSGDLVIVRGADSYRAGQIVAYRVPRGQFGEGVVIIHRIVGGSPADGFVMQGDNNPDADEWHPTTSDILGAAWLLVPRAGLALSALHAPLPLASLATGVVIALILTPSDRRQGSRRQVPSARPSPPPRKWPTVP